MTDNATSLATTLTSTGEQQLGRRYRNESNVKFDLAQLIGVLGYGPVETEHSIPGGSIDIYVPHHRVIIETKGRGLAADPHKPQGAERESPKGQLDRYVLSEIRTELSTFDWDSEDRSKQPWVGVVTDGTIWHSWRYPHEDNPEVETIPLETTSDADALINAITAAFGTKRTGKPWVPIDPADLFRDHEKRLENLYRQLPRAVQTRTETKQQLWLDMLRVSGIAPHDNDADRLFVTHSLLIAIARLVAHGLTRGRGDWLAALNDGFVSWITDSHPGQEWASELHRTVEEHDWKRRRHDVMQSLYMDFVSPRDRKVFGEYYTPDWLAALIVQEALDEAWRSRAIEQAEASARTSTRLEGIGVLDPTCGSGTFLYHAARRILNAPEMGQLSPGRQADITASLVHGIDVHPVAVEIAKTNMMRVLPTTPRAGAAAIQIRMGDSLMADNQSTRIFDIEGTMRIVTPKGREISLPMSFVRRVTFAEDMGRVVSAAVNQQEIAPAVLIGLDTADRRDLKQARDELAETIDDEGNSVWTWYAVNLAGPHLLSEQKVDRIVANPPWVKLSEIQHVPRKRAMEQFGKNLGIYQGGKQAPHTDIAAFFIRRARELYLENPGSNPAIWLVKKSSLRAGQWAAFRELHHNTLAQSVDLEDLQPFEAGDATRCCLLLEHRPMARTMAPALRATMRVDHATKRPAARPQRDETLETALKRIRFMPTLKQPVQRSSAYFTQTGEAEFQQGASIVPHVLTIAETTAPADRRDRVRVTTRRSSKAPWNTVEPRTIEIPRHWLTDVFSSSTVPSFAARSSRKAIIPMDGDGNLLKEDDITEKGWLLLNDLYTAHAGAGRNTPPTLLKQLANRRKLTAQLPLRRGTRRNLVLCPKSGDIMRAARTHAGSAVADDTLYWYHAQTGAEAAYLTILLNTNCLQHAFTSAKESGRDFHLHPWRKVPIPRYDKTDPLHREIAGLCTRAEKIATATVDAELKRAPNREQPGLSKAVREALTDAGVDAEMDECARQLLPDQATERTG